MQDFTILAIGLKNGTHQLLISCIITENGKITDLTGDNAIVFPECMQTMTVKQRRSFVEKIAHTLIDYKLDPKSLHDGD
jgi:hypothetical protein